MRLTSLLLVAGLAGVCGHAAADDSSGMPSEPAVSTAAASDRDNGSTRELIMRALSYLGINYKYGGESPDTGFDCSGLVNYVFSQASGLMLPREARAISRVGEKISRDALQPGDLVFFNTLRRPFSHIGIYLGEQRFIHAPGRGGQVEIADMSRRYWKKRYNGARRVSR